MLTDEGEHFDTIRLKTQAPGFAGVMCYGRIRFDGNATAKTC